AGTGVGAEGAFRGGTLSGAGPGRAPGAAPARDPCRGSGARVRRRTADGVRSASSDVPDRAGGVGALEQDRPAERVAADVVPAVALRIRGRRDLADREAADVRVHD